MTGDLGDIALIITALVGLISGLAGARAAWRTSAQAAKKDEIELLRGEVTRLQERLVCVELENANLHKDLLALRSENMWLRLVLAKAGIEIPPMPKSMTEPDPNENP